MTVHERTQLEVVQRDFRDYNNVSVIIYEQPCATERRRLRKRGQWHDPDKRVFIHPTVCEGCGDCGTVSNCMAIEPLETEFGRKRQINQSSCNKDFSCVEGFCPSFVTIEGAKLKSRDQRGELPDFPNIPIPELPKIDGSWSVLVAGIGGTGVVTIGQTLAVAAHADGLYSSNLDVTGLAQKYGAVLSHIKVSGSADQLTSTRIANGEADTLIGADVIVSAGDEVLATLVPGKSRGVVSTHLTPTADFSRDPNWNIDETMLISRLDTALENNLLKIDSIVLAERLLGDAVYANTLLLGAAWQMGGVPVSYEAIMRALELNGVAIEMNKVAFELGRYANHDLEGVLSLIQDTSLEESVSETLDEQIERRSKFLIEHSNEALADKYLTLVSRVRDKESLFSKTEALTEEVAKYYFKVLAHKDQWEVARLYADPNFKQALRETFDGKLKLSFHLGGWPFGKKIEGSEKIIKAEVGGWVMFTFKLLAKFRWLRGSILDPFRNSAESRAARALISQYENDVETILEQLNSDNLETAAKLASIPDLIRGYGHVRQKKTIEANEVRMKFLAELLSQPTSIKDNLIAKAS